MMNIFDHSSGDYLTSGDRKIYYEFHGNREGPVILFLHGGFGSMEDFKSLTPSLSKDYCLLGMDSPGHGRSTLGNSKLTYALIQQTAEELLKHLNIIAANIIGLSDGGIVAYRIAAAANVQVTKLITTGSRWHVNDALQSEALFRKMSVASWKEKFPETVDLYQRYNPEPDFNRLFDAVIDMWLDKKPTGYLNEGLKVLSMPVLIARGDDDHLTTRKSLAELADLIEKSTFLNLPFAGHVVFNDQPEIYQALSKQFLDKIT